ncbi:uncharacterized protein LOC141912236 [Tubulanus polymorphus]|uniref:uncharacterized protein LOC141912236 n=1 Tax=Tubulanus polymorphus TaxID=672921 RepID=UPI003DA30D5C
MNESVLDIDDKVNELVLGDSFFKDGAAFHAIRYDFKPASVDTSQVAEIDVGSGNQVSVTVPHVEGSGTSHTVYKGNKRPSTKECVLIIDNVTGEIRLEKLESTLQLKKTRMEGSRRLGQVSAATTARPVTPSDMKMKDLRTSPNKKLAKKQSKHHHHHHQKQTENSSSSTSSNTPQPVKKEVPSAASKKQVAAPEPVRPEPTCLMKSETVKVSRNSASSPVETMDDSSDSNSSSDDDSSSSSSDSDSDSGPESNRPPAPPGPPPVQPAPPPPAPPTVKQPSPRLSSPQTDYMNTLSADLQLSESGSDSD